MAQSHPRLCYLICDRPYLGWKASPAGLEASCPALGGAEQRTAGGFRELSDSLLTESKKIGKSVLQLQGAEFCL